MSPPLPRLPSTSSGCDNQQPLRFPLPPQAIKLDSSDASAYALRGRALLQHGDYSTAKAHFGECMDVDPDRQVRTPHAPRPLTCPRRPALTLPPAPSQECKEGFKTTKAIVKAKEAGEAALGAGRWADAVASFEAGEAADRVTPVWVREVRVKLARALGKAARHADALAVLAKLFSAPHTSPLPDDGCPECHQTAAEAHLALGDRRQQRGVSVDRRPV